MRMARHASTAASVTMFCAFVAGSSFAQPYPTRQITMVVAAAAGGPTDIVGRLVGQMLTESLGQSVVVENRTGAGLTVGTAHAARAKPDGYTLTIASPSSHSIAPGLYASLPYDPIKDFEPISLLFTSPTALVVNPALPAKTLKEFIAYAKSRPGQLNYGSGGNGTTSHLTAELFKTTAGVDLVHVPYKGSGPASTDLIAGQVQMMFQGLHLALPFIKAGKLRTFGVTSAQRSSMAPDLPTLDEAGLPGFSVNTWYGVMAPAGTPKPVIAQLNGALLKAINAPGIRQKLTDQGLVAVGTTPEEFAALIQEELRVWAKVIKQSGARVD
ncbi:MAG: tripartite tricarboxylate transporter substrate binding protein [Proteobacteria bacterium]|nr:tripartite tricarboxylate transporter substrate binding protein [Burkholderiales bacterium]